MPKEEAVVAASVVLNLYNDAENLLSHAGSYISTYQQLYAKYNNSVEQIPEEEKKLLRDLSTAIKILVYRTYKRAEGLSNALGIELPKEMKDGYEEIIQARSQRNLDIIYPPDLETYITGLYNFVIQTTVEELLKVSKGVLKELGV